MAIAGIGPIVLSNPGARLDSARLEYGLYYRRDSLNFDEPQFDFLDKAAVKMLQLYVDKPDGALPLAIDIRKWIEKHLGYENIKGDLRVMAVHRGQTIRVWCYSKRVFLCVWRLFEAVEDKYYRNVVGA